MDIDARAQAISDSIPARIRAKVAYEAWIAVEDWRMMDPRESYISTDRSVFYFEGVCYNPQIDFYFRKG